VQWALSDEGELGDPRLGGGWIVGNGRLHAGTCTRSSLHITSASSFCATASAGRGMPTGATRHRPVSFLGATSDTKMTLDKGLEMKKSDCPGLGGDFQRPRGRSARADRPAAEVGLRSVGYWYARSVEFLDLQGTRGRA
jgi:hypothetical protein